MALLDVAAEVGIVARTDGIEEIGIMFRSAGGCPEGGIRRSRVFRCGNGKRLLLAFFVCLPTARVDLHPAVGTEEKVADLGFELTFGVGVSAAGLELKDLAVGILEYRGLQVGRLLRALLPRPAEYPAR